PITTRGRVDRRWTQESAEYPRIRHLLQVGSETFQVSLCDYRAVALDEGVSVTYWPHTRTIKSVDPFRPVDTPACTCRPSHLIDAAWLTSNVVALAQAIFDEKAYDRLPILADALEDAGCDQADILNHCRQPGEHVRGCWVWIWCWKRSSRW